ncbi:MAG: glycoside hydrolase family 1 protein [Candidatus Omnitrophica bacterium]|nr:glycoside hydrolase family 1 protein [Candidatus Omnitrophota bacterium]
MPEFAFPDGFLWGGATSAHQVEGHNVHSDWWTWEQAGRVKEPSGLACDHYRRFAQDFDLAAALGHNAHRFSVEWSRVEPAEGQWDEAALAHYIEVVRALRQRRLEPIVTLHHFTNPQWLLAQGGWTNPIVVERFARYARKVADALGDAVRYWIPINEPMVYVRMHYIQGLGPPGVRDLAQGLRVTEHLIRAHAAAYHALHDARRPAQPRPHVGIAHHIPAFHPCRRWWPPDRRATRVTDGIFNRAMLEAMTEGRWSVPGIGAWRLPDARSTLDFLGVNFYGRQFIHWARGRGGWPAETCDLGHHREVTERTSLGWDVSPEAFGEVLLDYQQIGLPIFVTENGTYMADDARRWRFILRHVQAMARAMQAGARVIGYLYWSLLDNFEWAEGFGPRFGLVEVDYGTQARTVRESGRRYAELCRANVVPVSDTGEMKPVSRPVSDTGK